MIGLFPFWRSRLSNPNSSPPIPPSVILLGGKDYPTHYLSPADTYREEEYQHRITLDREELKRNTEELALAEKRTQNNHQLLAKAREATRQKKATRELAALEVQLQEEINVLRMERVRLMRLIDDEETILVLLLSQPLH